ncbi:MAG: hypothetical protein ACLF0P_15085 [Thermoanaerobaculia bacterium]
MAVHGLLAGLCPLIPVPFLDDRALTAVRRGMVRTLARERGVTLSSVQVDYLAGTYRAPRGCLAWTGALAVALTLTLGKKLFRKVLIFLAVKESADTASRVLHEGYLVHVLLDPAIAATRAPAGDAEAWRARRALEATVADADPRPVEQAIRRTFRGSRGALRRAARGLGRAIQRNRGRLDPEQAVSGEASLRSLVDRLTAELWQERGYWTALERDFARRLAGTATERGVQDPR